MTYHLDKSEWMNGKRIPEGMQIAMVNNAGRLESLLNPAIASEGQNQIFIDLGCGTGILGLYALSKGASFVYFVEQDQQMCHILENVLPKQIDKNKFKIITKDVEALIIDDFDQGTPTVTVSELFGPRLFDEGYVALTRHVKSLFPKMRFIPEEFIINFSIEDIDYNHLHIWPKNHDLLPHYKFMYAEKGFAVRPSLYGIYETKNLANKIGRIYFNANTLEFKNNIEFTNLNVFEKLIIGMASIRHHNFQQPWTTMGWYLPRTDYNKTFHIYFDETNYFNPVKVVKN